MKIYTLLFCLIFGVLSCSSPSTPDDPEKITFTLSEIPVIRGFLRTDAAGNILGYIGQPPEKQNFPNGVKLYTRGSQNRDSIETIFSFPADANVLIVVAKARFLEQEPNTSIGGAVISGSQKIIVRTLVRQQLQAGTYSVPWNGKDEDGREVVSGFYRIYFVTKNFTVWADTFYAKNPSDKPPFIP